MIFASQTFFFTIAYNTNITYITKTSYNTNITYNTYITYNTNITYATTDITYNTTVTYTTITTNTTITHNNNYYRCSAYTTDNTNLALHCTLITQFLLLQYIPSPAYIPTQRQNPATHFPCLDLQRLSSEHFVGDPSWSKIITTGNSTFFFKWWT